jgi:hypothetical protein
MCHKVVTEIHCGSDFNDCRACRDQLLGATKMINTIDKQPADAEVMKPGFYGEWVAWEDDDELNKAYEYLALWKHFFVRKLRGLEQVGHDQIVLRPKSEHQAIGTLGIKIQMRIRE